MEEGRGKEGSFEKNQKNDAGTLLDVGRGGVITARGTAEGLVIRIDGRVELSSLEQAVSEFMKPRSGFIAGHEVSLEWVGKKPEEKVIDRVSNLLSEQFSVQVKALSQPVAKASVPSSVSSSERKTIDVEFAHSRTSGGAEAAKPDSASAKESASLFDGINGIGVTSASTHDSPQSSSSRDMLSQAERSDLNVAESIYAVTDPAAWDDADARIVFTTLRSGQNIETEHSLVLIGDVNPGAEIIAGGDVIVLGSLRGVAHAGAYEETGGGRIIFALNLQPTQLRIGTTISRGSSDGKNQPEMARVEGNLIVVEPFQAKSAWFRR